MAKPCAAAILSALVLAGPALAQPQAPADAGVFPPPDPQSWWDDARPKAPEAADPLGARKLARGERLTLVDNGVDPSTYRLWGLQPLQTQVLRGDEMILEVWVRPARGVRQTVIRLTVRRGGDAFVQARAGEACCEAGIGRRVGFDAETPPGSASALLALRSQPLWTSPREVRVDEGGGATEALCVDGTAYDLTLVVPGRAHSVRRACDSAEIGEAADVLEAAFRTALGHEPRIDVLFPRGADFAAARHAYASLIAGGGRLKPDPDARAQAPSFEPAPVGEPQDAAVTPSSPRPTTLDSRPGSAP